MGQNKDLKEKGAELSGSDNSINETKTLNMPQPPLAYSEVKYRDLIAKDHEQRNQEQLDLFAEESEMNIQNSILATKKQIATVRRNLADKKSEKPLNPEETIKISQELKALQNGLAALEELKAELF